MLLGLCFFQLFALGHQFVVGHLASQLQHACNGFSQMLFFLGFGRQVRAHERGAVMLVPGGEHPIDGSDRSSIPQVLAQPRIRGSLALADNGVGRGTDFGLGQVPG